MAIVAIAGNLFMNNNKSSTSMMEENEKSGTILSDPTRMLPHVQQKSSWDCGIACCLMILRYLCKSPSDWKSVVSSVGTDSVWSIDLAFLLSRYEIPFSYHTITIGVKPDYSTMPFYTKNIDADTTRVNRLFDSAEAHGVKIHKRSVPLEELIRHLALAKLILLLVDASMLRCKRCRGFRWWKRSAPNERSPYQGHYILLHGYDATTRDFLYHDPSKSEEECRIAEVDLELARKREGTDEDIFFIYS